MSSSGGIQRRKGAGCEGVACEHTLGEQPLHLYGYLWAKPPVQRATTTAAASSSSAKSKTESADDTDVEHDESDEWGRFSAVVTDTVVFKHQKPVKWLFTSKQDKGKVSECRSEGRNTRLLRTCCSSSAY